MRGETKNQFSLHSSSGNYKQAPKTQVLISLLISLVAARGDQFDHLTPRPSGTQTDLRGIVFSAGSFVGIGHSGTILTSTDASDWTPRSSGITNQLNGVTYGNGLFVAVGDSLPGGQSPILTSPDGVVWTRQNSGTSNNLNRVAYGGAFVAVGASGTILYSTNGLNWRQILIPGLTASLNGVGYAAYWRYVAAGDNGTILTSPDGQAWTIRFSGTFAKLNAVAFGAGNTAGPYIIAGDYGTILTSHDGNSWTVRTSGTANNLLDIDVDAASPITVGVVGEQGTFLTSSDGYYSWTRQPTETTSTLRGVAYESGGFVAVGDAGTIQGGFVWTVRQSGVTNNLRRVAYGNGWFVGVGAGGVILRSPDGAQWSQSNSGTTSDLNTVTYGNGRFMAGGSGGVVLTSADGLDWSSQTIPGFEQVTGIKYGNTSFLAVGYYLTYPYGFPTSDPLGAWSSDGLHWTVRDLPASIGPPVDVTYGAGLFVVATVPFQAAAGAVATSPDGLSWSITAPPRNLNTVTFGNGRFIAGGNYGAFMSSTDGTNWTSVSAGHSDIDNCGIATGLNAFVAVGGGSVLYSGAGFGSAYITSSDGIGWTVRGASRATFPSGIYLRGVAYGQESFVAVGDAGIICQSVPTPSRLGIRADPLGSFLTITGNIGRNCQILRCTNLSASSWELLTLITNAPFKTNVLDDAQPRPAQSFYRSLSD